MKTFWILLVLLSLPTYTNPAAVKRVTIGYLQHPASEIYKKYISKSYADIGIKVKFVVMPVTRRLLEANDGHIDGIIVTTSSNNERFPNLVKVGPAIATVSMELICLTDMICDNSILDDNRITILTSKGTMRVIESELHMSLNSKLYIVDNEQQLFDMFKKGRSNYLLTSVVLDETFTKFKKENQSVRLGSYSLYHHIHKSKVDIADDLAKALRANMSMIQSFIKSPDLP